ncbi:hypothetical protein T09_12602, partial [Trichinella sp. T9]
MLSRRAAGRRLSTRQYRSNFTEKEWVQCGSQWLRAVVESNSTDVMSWSRVESGTKRSNALNPVGRSTAEIEADLLAPVGES